MVILIVVVVGGVGTDVVGLPELLELEPGDSDTGVIGKDELVGNDGVENASGASDTLKMVCSVGYL